MLHKLTPFIPNKIIWLRWHCPSLFNMLPDEPKEEEKQKKIRDFFQMPWPIWDFSFSGQVWDNPGGCLNRSGQPDFTKIGSWSMSSISRIGASAQITQIFLGTFLNTHFTVTEQFPYLQTLFHIQIIQCRAVSETFIFLFFLSGCPTGLCWLHMSSSHIRCGWICMKFWQRLPVEVNLTSIRLDSSVHILVYGKQSKHRHWYCSARKILKNKIAFEHLEVKGVEC